MSAIVLRSLRERLAVLAVPDASLYRTHDLHSLRRRSPAFLSYLDRVELEREAVVEAHDDESSGDEADARD